MIARSDVTMKSHRGDCVSLGALRGTGVCVKRRSGNLLYQAYVRLINLKRKEFVFGGSKNSNRTDGLGIVGLVNLMLIIIINVGKSLAC